ncbi:TPA: hypothetical protein ACS72K_003737 [Providencia alcalifaciens]
MSAFTIFFCGTASNYTDSNRAVGKNSVYYHDGELISTLAQNMTTPQYQDWIIVDGPGSGNLREKQKWIAPTEYSNLCGMLRGLGWEENVQHAMAVLTQDTRYIDTLPVSAEQHKQKMARKKGNSLDKITQVNLVGWSRGGVTCHMMANAMLNMPQLSNVNVNIFAVDPVPGLGNFAPHRTLLGRNVRQYCAIYARDEHSIGFTPTLPIFSPGCLSFIISMSGRHATLVGNASATGRNENNSPANFPQPGRIVRHLVEEKLTEWQVSLKHRLMLRAPDILKMYDDILLHDGDYRKMGKNTYTGLGNLFSSTRTVGKGGHSYNTPWNKVIYFRALSPYRDGRKAQFVNNHHMNLFINEGWKNTDMTQISRP